MFFIKKFLFQRLKLFLNQQTLSIRFAQNDRLLFDGTWSDRTHQNIPSNGSLYRTNASRELNIKCRMERFLLFLRSVWSIFSLVWGWKESFCVFRTNFYLRRKFHEGILSLVDGSECSKFIYDVWSFNFGRDSFFTCFLSASVSFERCMVGSVRKSRKGSEKRFVMKLLGFDSLIKVCNSTDY